MFLRGVDFLDLLSYYTERKMKRKTKFNVEFQNNNCIYIVFSPHVSPSVNEHATTNRLSSKRRHKAGGHNAVPLTKSKESLQFWLTIVLLYKLTCYRPTVFAMKIDVFFCFFLLTLQAFK